MLLYSFLDRLDSFQTRPEKPCSEDAMLHLLILIDFLKAEFASITTRLTALLSHHEITYDLLWAIFKPNVSIYTLCTGSGQPRCIACDYSEFHKDSEGNEYLRVFCHYYDFNGTDFEESSMTLRIAKFPGVKKIWALSAFPLDLHPDKSIIRRKAHRLRTQVYVFDRRAATPIHGSRFLHQR